MASPSMQHYIGKLTVTIHRAFDIKNINLMSAMDPFCEVRLCKERFKTKVHTDGGRTPQWEQSFLFNVDAKGNELFHVDILNEGTVTNDRIGRAAIALDKLVASAGKGKTNHTVMDPDNFQKISGNVVLSVEYSGTGAPAPAPNATVAPVAYTTPPAAQQVPHPAAPPMPAPYQPPAANQQYTTPPAQQQQQYTSPPQQQQYQSPPQQYQPPPQQYQSPPQQYQSPPQQYQSPPQQQYGAPPPQQYPGGYPGQQQPQYGAPPQQQYGAPAPQYGAPPPQYRPPMQGAPVAYPAGPQVTLYQQPALSQPVVYTTAPPTVTVQYDAFGRPITQTRHY